MLRRYADLDCHGNDTIDGGAVTDTLNQDNDNGVGYSGTAGAGVTVDLIDGTAIAMAGSNAGSHVLLNITQVLGSSFHDVLLGSNRTEVFESFGGRGGDDVIAGRGGFDMARFTGSTGGVTVDLVNGTATGPGIGNDTLANIEGIRGSEFADVLLGGHPANGVSLDDGLYEFFRGRAGNDTIDGGQGYDITDYSGSTAGVKVVLNDTMDGSANDGVGGTDVLRHIEAVSASQFNDTLTGSDSAPFESFEGLGGNDIINGLGRIDRVDYFHAKAAVSVRLDLLERGHPARFGAFA